ncbi:MAG: hypothetical protein ABSH48_08620 [Verrucomicrobiota bacterium]|jgi:hypothetical protein
MLTELTSYRKNIPNLCLLVTVAWLTDNEKVKAESGNDGMGRMAPDGGI